MLRRVGIRVIGVALCGIGIPYAASGQATSGALVIRAVAEVETRAVQDGRDTLEIRNPGRMAVRAPVVTYAVPSHMMYVADSATGPGAEVRYSVDDGHFFDRPENLRVGDAEGPSRPAKPDEYTYIRWQLKNTLKSKSVAFARFRAVVK